MPSMKPLENPSPHLPAAPFTREVVVPARGLLNIERVALAACVAGGGSGAALILTKLFCL